MEKILLAVILSSLLPALAFAEDKQMQNTHTSASDVDMKENKHMSMGDNPFSAHDKKKVAKKNHKTSKGYSVIKYKK